MRVLPGPYPPSKDQAISFARQSQHDTHYHWAEHDWGQPSYPSMFVWYDSERRAWVAPVDRLVWTYGTPGEIVPKEEARK